MSSDAAVVLFSVALALCVTGIPGYVIARRRGLTNPWVGLVPFVGLWIVLCESTGHSGWFGLTVLIPTLGYLLISIWMAIEVPAHHRRTRWWTAVLIVPLLNLVGYWVYAFTLPKDSVRLYPAGA